MQSAIGNQKFYLFPGELIFFSQYIKQINLSNK
jgi:hypothetical protein